MFRQWNPPTQLAVNLWELPYWERYRTVFYLKTESLCRTLSAQRDIHQPSLSLNSVFIYKETEHQGLPCSSYRGAAISILISWPPLHCYQHVETSRLNQYCSALYFRLPEKWNYCQKMGMELHGGKNNKYKSTEIKPASTPPKPFELKMRTRCW